MMCAKKRVPCYSGDLTEIPMNLVTIPFIFAHTHLPANTASALYATTNCEMAMDFHKEDLHVDDLNEVLRLHQDKTKKLSRLLETT